MPSLEHDGTPAERNVPAAQRQPEAITVDSYRSCGACCVSLHDRFCDVTVEDITRLSRRFVAKHVRSVHYAIGPALATVLEPVATGPLKGIELARCAALRGSVLRRTSYSVYANRPSVCRESIQPGDRDCRWLRRELSALAGEA